ncbi:MAG: exodeoxyribonuclease VII small subunit [Raoultibacter sp.]
MNQALKPIETLSFREAMVELDGIVGLLESNTLELEESLRHYERGVALLGALRTRLNDAQQKVDVLMGELDTSIDDTTIDSTLQKA